MSKQIQYPATHITESAGCVLFHLSAQKICLLNAKKRNGDVELLIPKGRRNLNESRRDAAIRETTEETSYKCSLYPVKMGSRLTLAEDDEDFRDSVRLHENCTESFYMQLRNIGRKIEERAKIIWWFIAQVDEADYEKKQLEGWNGEVKENVKIEWLSFEDAVEELTYETDSAVILAAINLVKKQQTG
ncbi:hypothetical protein H072_8020 [Dactylellina haptotyla CBS 200.50]|uniref:Nudix hydrolase domain-containing protein n=1 Tax=Dactylellina haptotyla (strain CBS 200.50) TaxID=1284197 RepID=S8A5J7_DACHA|nr:hypothetical protein H072_8020 [Dactylellina haptotyla CBS 200.50]